MKVIFVASGNKTGGNVSSFVRSQYESLEAAGLEMLLLPVSGHGGRAYLKAAWELRRLVRRERPDIIHAHYSVCGHVAWLACLGLWRRPKIMISILGSFPKRNKKWRLVRFCIKHVWDKTLVKSRRTMNQLGLELPVVPNGVNLDIFHPMDYAEARKEVGFQDGKKYVIWCSHPERPEKNWALAEAAIAYLNEKNKKNTADAAKTIKIESNQKSGDSVCCEQHPQNECSASSLVSELPSQTQPVPSDSVQSAESSPYKKVDCINLEKSEKNDADAVLVAVYDKTPEEVCRYMDAADCLLLTSVSEGSPNVIKEAMACNCPIVTTDVGDVNVRLANLEGCFVVPDNELESERVREVAEAIEKALTFGERTEGRKRLIEDGLTVELTAKKIIKLYESII